MSLGCRSARYASHVLGACALVGGWLLLTMGACGSEETPSPTPTEPVAERAQPPTASKSDRSRTGTTADVVDPWSEEGLASMRPESRLLWPVESPHLTSRFGWRTDPVLGAGRRLHKGVDLRGARGDLVMSVGRGRVRFAGWDPALGNMVIVDHPGGLSSWYGHLSSIAVHAGLSVEAGSALGAVGNTGRSAAPHLHLTLKSGEAGGRAKGSVLDPLVWIDAG